jgi:hypothetical protein
MTEGTSRTLKWVAGGMRRSSDDDAGSEATTPAPPVQDESGGKSWGERLEERTGHSQRTIGLAIGAGLLIALWIGWTAYVWSENGSTAAIGVLISWPAALAAVTLVTAPFIGGAVAVRRHRAGEPVFAGAIAPADAPSSPAPEKEEEKEKVKEEEAEDEEPEDETGADEEKDSGSDDEPKETDDSGEDEESG